MKLQPFLSLSEKLSSKWIKDFNLRPNTLIEEEEGDSLELIVTGEDSLNRTPAAQVLRPIINKWDLVTAKLPCTAKNRVT